MKADYQRIFRIRQIKSNGPFIEHATDDVIQHMVQFDTAIAQLRLVMPHRAKYVLDAVQRPVDQFYTQLEAHYASCFEDLESDSKDCKRYSANALASRQIDSDIAIGVAIDDLKNCAYDRFSTGNYLTDLSIVNCRWSVGVDVPKP
ncbi:MAG: hypothetical protein WDM92_05640 [Caulobacteraceae bacterium]